MSVAGPAPQTNHKNSAVTGFTTATWQGCRGICNSDHETPPLLVTISCGFSTLSCANSQAVCALTLVIAGQPMSSGCIVAGAQLWPASVERITIALVPCCSTAQTAP